MIGFVEVDIEKIRLAYSYLKADEDCKVECQPALAKKVYNLNKIVGNKNSFFAKTEKLKIRKILEELVYSSFISSSRYMILRVEMASIIQDIIHMYEGHDTTTLSTD